MLLQRVHTLGGELSDSAQKVTHLVAGRVTRTVKFLASMSVVKHIVTPEWLEESWRSQKFVGRHWFYVYWSVRNSLDRQLGLGAKKVKIIIIFMGNPGIRNYLS